MPQYGLTLSSLVNQIIHLLCAKKYDHKCWFKAPIIYHYISAGSPADKAGLKPGDRILFLNGLDMRFSFFFLPNLSYSHSEKGIQEFTSV